MRIAFLTPWAVTDDKSWSGVVAPMYRALQDHTDVIPLETGNIKMSVVDRALLATLGRASRKPYLSGHALATSIKRSKITSDLVNESGADVVLCVAASQDIAFANIEQPIVQVTDATFRAMQDYYPLFANLHPLSGWQGGLISKRSQAKTSAFSVASEWAKTALREAGASQESRVIPFGPSIHPATPMHRRQGSSLRVLVVASDWRRKGGDLSVAAVGAARLSNPNISLTVVGNAPDLPEWVNYLGRVPREALPQIYADHDVLLELADANAGGVTLTDAHAFGLPVIATDTGGVSSIVADGVSGILIDQNRDTIILRAQAALDSLNGSLYQELVTGAINRHRDVLNWDVWARETTRLCMDSIPG